MKILFHTSITNFQKGNGGRTVFLKTKEYLERAGVHVDLFDPWRSRLSDYDIVHCFTMETTDLWHFVKASGLRLAVTPISWFGVYATPRSRVIRWMKRRIRSKIHCPLHGYWWEDSFKRPDMFFPQSAVQAVQLETAFGVSAERIHVVPHGVDRRFLDATPAAFIERYGVRDFVLCVSRFEPRKNQLALVRALRNTGLKLVFIGRPDASADEGYYEACVGEAGESAVFIRELDHESPLLASAYAAARVLVLPSLLEFPGIVVLEAGLAGCNVAVTQIGAAPEYLAEHAHYIDPYSPESIRRAVLESFESASPNAALQAHVRGRFLWETVVRQNVAGYETILSRPTVAT